jgi:hypothetical protein
MAEPDSREAVALAPGDHLPVTRLVEAPDSRGRSIPDRSRDALVIIYLPDDLAPWIGYLKRLEAAVDEIQHWYSQVVVIVTGAPGGVRAAVPRLAAATEEQPVLREMLGVQHGRAVLLIVDRYGQIYHRASGARAEDLTPVSEIEEWVTFLATQCPECGVIDEPGYGEWALT